MTGIVREETIGPCRLIQGDCLEVLPLIGRVDAVVTDPPYGVGFKYRTHNDSEDGYTDWCSQWFMELRRVTSGPIAISCGIVNITSWPQPDWVLCWYKPAAMGRCCVGFNNWEPVLVYGKTRGGQVVDVFKACIVSGENINHPCPKPIAWGYHAVRSVSAQNDLVLDPFMGSGTTGIGCIQSDRRFVGIEKDESYFCESVKRIRQAWRDKQSEIKWDAPQPLRQLTLEPEE